MQCTIGDFCKAGKCQTGSGGACICQTEADGGIVAVGSYGGLGPKGEEGPNGWVLRLDSTAATACD